MIKRIVCLSALILIIKANVVFSVDPNQKRLHVLTTVGLTDETGQLLPGNNLGRITITTYGPYIPGAVIQLLSAGPDGIANMPDCSGNITGDDTVIVTHAIGETIAIFKTVTGKFDFILTDNEIPTGLIYLRVFNRDSISGSSHYGQTQVVAVNDLTVASGGNDIYFYVNEYGLLSTNIGFGCPPVANAGGPYTVGEGSTIQFDASATADPDDPIENLVFEWDFDCDGQYDEIGFSPSYFARDNAVFSVGLRVTDTKNLVSYSTAQVTIVNLPPVIEAVTSTDKYVNEQVNLTAQYYDPGLDDTHTLDIDWGDGTIVSGISISGGVINLSHAYTSSGAYDVSLIVRDKDSATDTATTVVTIYQKSLDSTFVPDPQGNSDNFSITWNAIPGREYRVYYTQDCINWYLAETVVGNQFIDSGDQDGFDNIAGNSDDRVHPAGVKFRLYKIE